MISDLPFVVGTEFKSRFTSPDTFIVMGIDHINNEVVVIHRDQQMKWDLALLLDGFVNSGEYYTPSPPM